MTATNTTFTQVPVLADMDWKGQPAKVMLWANRNGFFYVLDRVTGKFLHGPAFCESELGQRPRCQWPADPDAAAAREGRL